MAAEALLAQKVEARDHRQHVVGRAIGCVCLQPLRGDAARLPFRFCANGKNKKK